MPKGFFYLVAIMDWHSRKVLSWRLSNTMDAIFCVEALEEALALYCCATIKTPRPATICHTSDGGAAFGGQASPKPPEAGAQRARLYISLTAGHQNSRMQLTLDDIHRHQ